MSIINGSSSQSIKVARSAPAIPARLNVIEPDMKDKRCIYVGFMSALLFVPDHDGLPKTKNLAERV